MSTSPGDHEERVVELDRRVAHRSGGAERRVLGGVAHASRRSPSRRRSSRGSGWRGTQPSPRCRRSRAARAARRCAPSSACSTSGIIGLGWLLVSGRRRVPSPPARITAFIAHLLRTGRRPVRRAALAQRGAGQGDVLERRVVAEARARRRRRTRRRRARGRGRVSMLSAQRNSGNANISDSVPALPAHCTSMRRAPAAASASTATLIDQLPDQHERRRRRAGTLPCTTSATPAVMSRIRSATGSSTLPRFDSLVEVARDPTVDPVGRPEHREQRRRLDALVVDEQPDEDRDAHEARHRDEVRDRGDPVFARRRGGWHTPMVRGHRTRRTGTCYCSPA